ncbi:unnamed protein product [Nesidiocoris tenuis]|uniref:CRAL-TRIO domain-containing protein n=1 Tax=Nesidiocoris tenuis TaxID=355587 RepID=A0A6H5G4Q6_9HEMI|nr:unnamed protein product [Nesidiocoris tenuis]
MVQKYTSPVRVYKYPFELVMKAYERRFPSCPQIPIVINCDVVSETESPDGSVRKTERRCKLHVDAPYLLKKVRHKRQYSLITDENDFLSNLPRGECQSQLDSEYIQRYLGQLTLMQESKLVQLRKSFAQLHKAKVPNDSTLLRFLRARDFHVEKARHFLSESLSWRKKHGVDKMLSEYKVPPLVETYFPGGWHHYDKGGSPIYLLRLGQMDVKGLLRTVGEDGLLRLTLATCEEGLRLMEEATLSSNTPVSSWCLLVDLEGLNMRHLWRPGIRALLHIIEIVEANYPETLGRVLIVRAPRVFPILWALVSTFIDDVTRTKFLFYGGNDYQGPGGLSDYISEEYIPDFLGGPCKTYEVKIDIDEPGAVITWDFDVTKDDVLFTVCQGEGREKVETPFKCRDGESVQGSHVAAVAGPYHLQWCHQGDHKANLMYFYEVVSSADYRYSTSRSINYQNPKI